MSSDDDVIYTPGCEFCANDFNILDCSKFTPQRPIKNVCNLCLNGNCQRICFVNMRRTIHMEDFEEVLEQQELKSAPMDRSYDQTNFSQKQFKVLTFEPVKNLESQHHFYGNVAFDVSMKDILERFENVYYIEHTVYKRSMRFKILFTRKTIQDLKLTFSPFLINSITPISMEPKENYSTTSTINRFVPLRKTTMDDFEVISSLPHNNLDIKKVYVDFVIDCDDDCGDPKWFFDTCHEKKEIRPVSHHEANRKWINGDRKYKPFSCYKFNNRFSKNDEGKKCPSEMVLSECKKVFKKKMVSIVMHFIAFFSNFLCFIFRLTFTLSIPMHKKKVKCQALNQKWKKMKTFLPIVPDLRLKKRKVISYEREETKDLLLKRASFLK